MSPRGFVILAVEDDPDDVFFLKTAFAELGLPDCLRVARDGEEAVDYLQGQGAFADRGLYPPPSLVLLDLKLPRKSGFEVLEWRRLEPAFRRIPVLVLTSSRSQADVAHAYDLGANAFLVKPIDAREQVRLVAAIRSFWLDLNLLP
ncbi:MAG: response regulator [Elusimicrobiota bacterium]|nr:response regulator [Elusimicrobiota bacterium]